MGAAFQHHAARAEKRIGWLYNEKTQVRVLPGEPYCVFRDVRYLIDFITTVSDVSPGLAPFDCDPGVDSNSSSDQHPPQTNRSYACQLPVGRPAGRDGPRYDLRRLRRVVGHQTGTGSCGTI